MFDIININYRRVMTLSVNRHMEFEMPDMVVIQANKAISSAQEKLNQLLERVDLNSIHYSDAIRDCNYMGGIIQNFSGVVDAFKKSENPSKYVVMWKKLEVFSHMIDWKAMMINRIIESCPKSRNGL